MLRKTPKDLSEHVQAAPSRTTGTCMLGHILGAAHPAPLVRKDCFLLMCLFTEIWEGGARPSQKQAAGAGCQKHSASPSPLPLHLAVFKQKGLWGTGWKTSDISNRPRSGCRPEQVALVLRS